MRFRRKRLSDEYLLKALCLFRKRGVRVTQKALSEYLDCSESMVREGLLRLKNKGKLTHEEGKNCDYALVVNGDCQENL